MTLCASVADNVSLYGPQIVKAAMFRAANGTVDDAFQPTGEHSQDSTSRKKKSTFFDKHKSLIRRGLKAGTTVAIPALLASTKHVPSQQNTDGHGHGASGLRSALSVIPNYGTNTNAYANGAPPGWLSPSRAPSLADLRSHFPDPSEVATPTITCSQSRAAYSTGESDSDDSTIRSRNAFAPTSVLSAHSPRASYSTPASDCVNQSDGSPSIVSRYDHEYRGRSAADQRGSQGGWDGLEDDVFSKDDGISASESVRTAYRRGSSQW